MLACGLNPILGSYTWALHPNSMIPGVPPLETGAIMAPNSIRWLCLLHSTEAESDQQGELLGKEPKDCELSRQGAGPKFWGLLPSPM